MNFVYETGRITSDVELKQAKQNLFCVEFTIAVFSKCGNIEYLPCIAWREKATDIARMFKKGDKIAVVGEIKRRAVRDRQKKKRWVLDVEIEKAVFAESDKRIPDFEEHVEPAGSTDQFWEEEVPI